MYYWVATRQVCKDEWLPEDARVVSGGLYECGLHFADALNRASQHFTLA